MACLGLCGGTADCCAMHLSCRRHLHISSRVTPPSCRQQDALPGRAGGSADLRRTVPGGSWAAAGVRLPPSRRSAGEAAARVLRETEELRTTGGDLFVHSHPQDEPCGEACSKDHAHTLTLPVRPLARLHAWAGPWYRGHRWLAGYDAEFCTAQVGSKDGSSGDGINLPDTPTLPALYSMVSNSTASVALKW